MKMGLIVPILRHVHKDCMSEFDQLSWGDTQVSGFNFLCKSCWGLWETHDEMTWRGSRKALGSPSWQFTCVRLLCDIWDGTHIT